MDNFLLSATFVGKIIGNYREEMADQALIIKDYLRLGVMI